MAEVKDFSDSFHGTRCEYSEVFDMCVGKVVWLGGECRVEGSKSASGGEDDCVVEVRLGEGVDPS